VSSVFVSKSGVFVLGDGSKAMPKRVAAGWELEWICENVYAWVWLGPGKLFSGYVPLVVLPYEPGSDERAKIEAAFASAPTPDGDPRFRP